MIDVALTATPNQEFSIQLDGRFYEISLRECAGVMSASITRDGAAVVTNLRVTPGTPLLPYRYQESGNFILTTEGEALPYWDQFSVTQFLTYLTADELATYRSA